MRTRSLILFLALAASGMSVAANSDIVQIRAEIFSESGKEIGDYYYKDGKLIRWRGETRKELDAGSQEYKDAEKRLLEFSNDLLLKFKGKI